MENLHVNLHSLYTSRLRVREYEVYTWNFSIIYTYRLRVRESKHSLYISRFEYKKIALQDVSTVYEYDMYVNLSWVWGMPHYSVISDLRVREVNLVYEYTHSFNEKCFSSAVRLWIDSFAPSPVPPVVRNERIQVQIECVRCKNHSVVNGASKHAWLPSQTAFTTLASPRPYHPNSPPLLSRHLVWCKSMRRSLW